MNKENFTRNGRWKILKHRRGARTRGRWGREKKRKIKKKIGLNTHDKRSERNTLWTKDPKYCKRVKSALLRKSKLVLY